MSSLTKDWADKQMFLEELDTLPVDCVQLNRPQPLESEPAVKKATGVNPKKNKRNKNKKKKNPTADATPAAMSTPPKARGGATITYLPTTKQLLLLGGADRVGQEYGFENVHLFDVLANAWVTHTTTGTVPGPRNGHTATLVEQRWLYVFGGLHVSSQSCYNDLYCLDLSTMAWQHHASSLTGTPPSARNGHTACAVVNDQSTDIYVFGGSSPVEGLMNDVHVLHVQHQEDAAAATTAAGATAAAATATSLHWKEEFNQQVLRDSSAAPTPREAHTCIVSGTCLYVYGKFLFFWEWLLCFGGGRCSNSFKRWLVGWGADVASLSFSLNDRWSW
jgi:hypothetical protein